MKKIALLGSVLALTACATHHSSKVGLELNPVVPTNIEAKMEEGKRVHGKSDCWNVLYLFDVLPDKRTYLPEMQGKYGKNGIFVAPEACVAGAVYDAVSKIDADVLVSPQYTTANKGFLCIGGRCLIGKTTTVVSGWASKISQVK